MIGCWMPDDGTETSPEREQTDNSLRTERRNADEALKSTHADVHDEADLVLQRARDKADSVLAAARDKADEDLAHPLVEALATDRVLADVTVRTERAAADEQLRREREEGAAALSRLLPMEREKTDRYLLTERTRSDTELAHRDAFLGIVSHDLRNLLSGIVLSANLLADRATDSMEGTQALDVAARIERYAARMNRLIGDLVDVASIDAGRLSIEATKADTSLLIVEAVDMFRGLAANKGLTLEAVTPGPLPGVFDHDRMIQVLANLITNAIKFTQKGGSIIVTNDSADGRLRISVRDTGIGISADKLGSVFERFWQVSKNDPRGVGLGLYISRSIVEAHGGTIWVESAPGQGTSFSFTLTA